MKMHDRKYDFNNVEDIFSDIEHVLDEYIDEVGEENIDIVIKIYRVEKNEE